MPLQDEPDSHRSSDLETIQAAYIGEEAVSRLAAGFVV